MKSSIFSVEVAARMDRAPGLLDQIRATIADQNGAVGLQNKWQAYRHAAEALLGNLGAIERGCWDYFEDPARAEKDFKMWLGGMTTEEGVRATPSGAVDPYRGGPRYLTFTMTFLMISPSPSDEAIRRLCEIPESDIWRRDVFGRILAGMGVINFASVQSDVMYLIPRDQDWDSPWTTWRKKNSNTCAPWCDFFEVIAPSSDVRRRPGAYDARRSLLPPRRCAARRARGRDLDLHEAFSPSARLNVSVTFQTVSKSRSWIQPLPVSPARWSELAARGSA